MKRVWKIDVPGRYGYSLAIRSNDEYPDDAIDTARDNDLLMEYADADYASAEDITNDAYEMAHWKGEITDIPEEEEKTYLVGVVLPISLCVEVSATSPGEALQKAKSKAMETDFSEWDDDASKMQLDILND